MVNPLNFPKSEFPVSADTWVAPDSWLLADAWVLAAARVCGTAQARGGLFDLVAAGDAVNQLIVSHGELEHAMAMLVGAELLVADEWGIGVTDSGRKLVARASRSLASAPGRRSSETRIAALFAQLSQLPVTPIDFVLDPSDYEAACLEYRHTRWSEFRRPERSR